MTKITIQAGPIPAKEQIKRIRAAANAPITYTQDCLETTTAGITEFAAKARKQRQSRGLVLWSRSKGILVFYAALL
ncbi:MAG: hypothetical protein LBP88_02080 [Treponema sp.]|jgi:hypothetical protein|nr:hypothetical protein [Treponema sp.]